MSHSQYNTPYLEWPPHCGSQQTHVPSRTHSQSIKAGHRKLAELQITSPLSHALNFIDQEVIEELFKGNVNLFLQQNIFKIKIFALKTNFVDAKKIEEPLISDFQKSSQIGGKSFPIRRKNIALNSLQCKINIKTVWTKSQFWIWNGGLPFKVDNMS